MGRHNFAKLPCNLFLPMHKEVKNGREAQNITEGTDFSSSWLVCAPHPFLAQGFTILQEHFSLSDAPTILGADVSGAVLPRTTCYSAGVVLTMTRDL